MTSITVGLDDQLAARLTEQAARVGVEPAELARQAVVEYLEHGSEGSSELEFVGMGSSAKLRGTAVDELLAEGFGR